MVDVGGCVERGENHVDLALRRAGDGDVNTLVRGADEYDDAYAMRPKRSRNLRQRICASVIEQPLRFCWERRHKAVVN